MNQLLPLNVSEKKMINSPLDKSSFVLCWASNSIYVSISNSKNNLFYRI